MMDSLLLKGLTEVSLTEFNTLHHAYTVLNRSLPAHAQLGDSLIAEKLCAVVRCLSESINTILEVKLVMEGATGNLALTLVTIRKVFGDFEARKIHRSIELDKSQGRAFVAKQLGKDKRTNSPLPRASPHAKQEGQIAPSGSWTNRFVKCRHRGGRHWHRN